MTFRTRLDGLEIRKENVYEYEHRTNVHYLPGAKARQQAHLSHVAVEEDRKECRRDEIRRLIDEHRKEIECRQRLINCLQSEGRLLEDASYV